MDGVNLIRAPAHRRIAADYVGKKTMDVTEAGRLAATFALLASDSRPRVPHALATAGSCA